MFKNTLIIAAVSTTMLASIAHAQQNQDPGQQAGQGIGYAFTIQERCIGHAVRSPEAEKNLQARVVNAISKQTGSPPETVRLGFAAGAMQANFTPKPTRKDCKEAEKLVAWRRKCDGES